MPRHLATVLLLLGLPTLALAHGGADLGHAHGALRSMAAGFAHPFAGWDHLAAMVAVGLWGSLTRQPLWRAPLAFSGALLAGALLGLSGIALPAIEPMIAASLLVLGLLVASGARLPWGMGVALVAGFAVFHGAAHGTELAGPQAGLALAGMVLATASLHALGLGLGMALRGRSAWLPRLAGGAVALFGATLLALP